MRTIPIWLFLSLLPFSATTAQQARGLFFSVHGPDAPRSVGDPNSLQALYFDIPATSDQPIYVRVFDAETGGYLDARRGAFNTKTRFVILGGASANQIHGIDHNPARNRRLTFPASDIIHDVTIGTNARIDGRYLNMGALPLAKGYPITSETRRFALLAFSVEGDDANYFDYVLSLDPNDKVPPPGVSMFTYELTLRTPETRQFKSEIRIPTDGLDSIRIETFGVSGAPMQLNIPFQESVPISSPGTGQWVRQSIAIPSNSPTVGLQFQGLGTQNTFSVIARRPDGSIIPIPLPILDFEPVSYPRFSFRTSYVDTSCVNMQFSKLGDIPANFEVTDTRWVFESDVISGTDIQRRFDAPGVYHFRLEIDGRMGGVPQQVVIEDSVTINQRPSAWAGGNRVTVPGRSMAFDGTVSEDEDGRITKYEWDFGDGKTGAGARIDYQYDNPGSYTITLTVYDDSNSPCNTAVSSATVLVNRPPIARIQAPAAAQRGDVITFDASGSSDPDGTVVDYAWVINGTEFEGETVEWTVATDAPVLARLRITDNARTTNSTANAEHRVRVNMAPIAEAGNDKHVSPNRPATFVGERSSDPDGRIVAYEWIFPGDVRREGARVEQGILEPGWHTVYLDVTDNEGAVGRDSLIVRVNHPPVPVVTGDLEVEGRTVSLSASTSYDLDEDAEIIRYEWAMGDGTTLIGPDITHTYRRDGAFTATLTIADNSGTFSSIQATRVEVQTGVAPVVVAPVTPDVPEVPVVETAAAPIARAVVPNRAAPGSPFQVDIRASENANEFYWFENGEWVSGDASRTFTHSSTSPFTVRYAVDNGAGQANSRAMATATIRMNRAPEALAMLTNEALTDTLIVFDGSYSSDPDGDRLTYEWFVDGESVGSTARLEHRFLTPGRKTILLRVDDGFGLANSVSEWSRTLYIYSR
jgi:PKD repeat protein